MDSLPYKTLLAGFAFFILIVVSSYVANLAAFLTRDKLSYVGSIREAIKTDTKICAHPALKNELELVYPEAKFVFTTGDREFYSVLEEYKDGQCGIMAVGVLDTIEDLKLMDLFCEEKLLYTDSAVLEIVSTLLQMQLCITFQSQPHSLTSCFMFHLYSRLPSQYGLILVSVPCLFFRQKKCTIFNTSTHCALSYMCSCWFLVLDVQSRS